MEEITAEWLRKAIADLRSAKIEFANPPPNHDLICFLSHQCIEKSFKAFLQDNRVRFSKTHDLILLFEQVIKFVPEWEYLNVELLGIRSFHVEFRYPGESATHEEAHISMTLASSVLELITSRLEKK